MSQAEVQSFLDTQGGSLAAMTFDTSNESGEGLCADYTGTKGESAAAIIDQSARACKVSQKVLLTVMQKEQHLVTAVDPSDYQLMAAMGLNCPDTADCDPAYAGFFRQVYGAAKRYRYYLEHEEQYGYTAHNLNYIQYHPNAACGGAQVYIENKATALLYIYTPTSRTSPHWPLATVPAIPAPVMATATSRLSTPAGSVRREADNGS